jgi:hypothetical protein
VSAPAPRTEQAGTPIGSLTGVQHLALGRPDRPARRSRLASGSVLDRGSGGMAAPGRAPRAAIEVDRSAPRVFPATVLFSEDAVTDVRSSLVDALQQDS